MRSLAELPGLRVVLVRDVERYPHFTAEAGRAGIVTVADDRLIAVKMDEHLPGAEEWDNEVCWDWCGDDVEQGLPEFWADCRPEVA